MAAGGEMEANGDKQVRTVEDLTSQCEVRHKEVDEMETQAGEMAPLTAANSLLAEAQVSLFIHLVFVLRLTAL
jgi:hypothetical protein